MFFWSFRLFGFVEIVVVDVEGRMVCSMVCIIVDEMFCLD